MSLSKRAVRGIVRGDFPLLRRKVWCHMDFGDKSFARMADSIAADYVDRARIWERRYQPDVYDCENFARSLKARVDEMTAEDGYPIGFAFGTIWGRFGGSDEHAVCWYINHMRQLVLCEPQRRAKFWTPTRKDRGIWKVEA